MTEAHAERFMAMGTRVELHVFGPCDLHLLEHGRRAIERVDDALTIHRPSPAVALNEALAAGGTARIDDPTLLAALTETRTMMALTKGLFDPAARAGCPPCSWNLDVARGMIEAEGPLAFDFGGIGKGIALDAAGAALRAGGVQSGLLSAGESSILAIGQHPLGGPWPIGVPHPLVEGAFLAELDLADEALSVSSTVHAVAAPNRQPTLRGVDGTVVTAPLTAVVIAGQGSRAEALSTALMAATPEEQGQLSHCQQDRMFIFRHDSCAAAV